MPSEGSIRAKVKHSENQGSNFAVYLDIEGKDIIALETKNTFKSGEEVFVNMMMDEIHFFHKETERNIGYPTNIIAKKKAASGINLNEENNKIAAL